MQDALIILVFKELIVRFGPSLKKALKEFIREALYNIKTESERKNIEEFYKRARSFDGSLEKMYQLFLAEIAKEYDEIHNEIENSFSMNSEANVRVNSSVRLAEKCNVDKDKIIRNIQELDAFFK